MFCDMRNFTKVSEQMCDALLPQLRRANPKKYLYELYGQRVASLRMLPFDPERDGASRFDTK